MLIERYIGRKSSIFHTSLLFDAPVRGVPVRKSPPHFGMEKLEWCGYPVVKKIRIYLYSFRATHERGRETDGQTDTASRHIPRLCIASRGKNRCFFLHKHTRCLFYELVHVTFCAHLRILLVISETWTTCTVLDQCVVASKTKVKGRPKSSGLGADPYGDAGGPDSFFFTGVIFVLFVYLR